MKSFPKVSVCIIAFNQANFIRQCLQSFVDQETNFDFEVIVSDDCSQDGTQEIVREFGIRYPSRVRAILNESNLGPTGNYLLCHGLARGEYIAYVDGDDYALPGKLQGQADYLDEHPECNFVWHRVFVLYEGSGKMVEDRIRLKDLPSEGFTRRDLLRYMTIGSNCAKMYRIGIRDVEIPPFPMMDFFINVEQIGDAKATFVSDKLLGVYRQGIGIATRNNFTRILQKKSLLFFFEKYPDCRTQISTAVIGRIVVAMIDRSWPDFAMFVGVLARVFRFGSVWDIVRHRKLLAMLRLP